jgi:hypothetical protein
MSSQGMGEAKVHWALKMVAAKLKLSILNVHIYLMFKCADSARAMFNPRDHFCATASPQIRGNH